MAPTTKLVHLLASYLLIHGFMIQAASSSCTQTVKSSPECGVRGHSTIPPVFFYANQTVRDLNECANLAFYGRYRSIAYDDSSKFCSFLTRHVLGPKKRPRVTKDPKSRFVFYDRRCFSCPVTCPPTDGANVLANGGFEASSKYIGPWAQMDLPRIYSIEPGHNSKHAAMIGIRPNALHGSSYYDGLIGQSANVCKAPGRTYYFTLQYNFATTKQIPPVFNKKGSLLYFSAGNLFSVLKVDRNLNDTWVTLRYSIQPPRGKLDGLNFSKIDVELMFVGRTRQDRLLVDNVAVAAIPPASFPPATKGPNKFANGGFANGKLSPWFSPPVANGDAGKAKIVPASRLYGTKGAPDKYAIAPVVKKPIMQIRQRVHHLKPRQKYLVSFDYRLVLTRADARPGFSISTRGDFYDPESYENNTKASIDWVYTASQVNETFIFYFAGNGYKSLVADTFSLRELA